MAGHAKRDVLEPVAGGHGQCFDTDLETPALHCELLHRRGDTVREFVAGILPLLCKLFRCGSKFALRALRALGQGGRIGGGRECVEFAGGGKQQFGQCFGPYAVLARSVVHCGQPLFDPFVFLRVEVETSLVIAQRMCGFVELDTRGCQQRHHIGQRDIVCRGGFHPVEQLRQPDSHCIVCVRQRGDAVSCGNDQCCGVREARLGRRELDPFARRNGECKELAVASVENLALCGCSRGALCGRIAVCECSVPRAPPLRDIQRQRCEAAIGIDKIALRLGCFERLMGMLAVNVDQMLAQVFHLGHRRRSRIDPRATLAAGVEHAPQQHRFVLADQIVLDEPGAHRWRVRDIEFSGEFGAVGAGAQLPRQEPVAEQQAECIEQDRFAGAGFAGQYGETGIEFDIQRIDNDKVANRERAQHGQVARCGGASRAKRPHVRRSDVRAFRSSGAFRATSQSNHGPRDAGTAP